MTKPSDEKFHYVEGVFRYEKHALVPVKRSRFCFFCKAEPPLPTAADLSAAIENGRDFVEPFGDEEGDYWPDDWIELVDSAGKLCACPKCTKKMLDSMKGGER